MDRRCKILWIDEEQAADMFGHWRQCNYMYLPTIESKHIPEDAKLQNVSYDWERRAFALQYSHESFPEVPNGERLPYINGCGEITYQAVSMKEIPELRIEALRPKDGDVIVLRVPVHLMEQAAQAAKSATQRRPGCFFMVMPKDADAILMPAAYREYVKRFGPNGNPTVEQIESFVADIKGN